MAVDQPLSSQLNARLSRRSLLRGLGAGAGAIAAAGSLPGLVAAGPAGETAGNSVEALRLARVWVDRDSSHLLTGFDDTHRVFEDGSVEVLLWPGDLARLDKTGLRFEITVDDLEARDLERERSSRGVSKVARQPGETASGDYRTLDQFNADMAMLAEQYPNEAKLLELPNKTLEGRTVYGLEIAENVHRRDGRAVFYNDGVHHAREWPAAEVPIMWAYDLLENYGSDPRITNIMRHVRNVVIPVVNPDGFTHSRSTPIGSGSADLGLPVGNPLLGGDGAEAVVLGGRGRYWRKNRRGYLAGTAGEGLGYVEQDIQGVDAYGIDPNRNYSLNWGDDEGGSSSDPHDQTFRGEFPFSEPETRNVSWVLSRYQCTAVISHHTSGDLVLWPWGDTYDDAPDDQLLQALGRAMAKYNGYVPQKGIDLYVTTGTMSDWTYGAYGSLGYTFEHAGSAFHPPYPETVPAMYDKNREALLLLAEEACIPPERRPDREVPNIFRKYWELGRLNHSVVKGQVIGLAGQPATLRLRKTFDTKLWKDGDGSNPLGQATVTETVETTIETAADGTFEWHVNPSTRPKTEFAGGTETYELAISAGDKGTVRQLVVRRGEVLDLGKIRLS